MQADLGKLPLWSGNPAKDGYTVKQWCKRVDKAAATAGQGGSLMPPCPSCTMPLEDQHSNGMKRSNGSMSMTMTRMLSNGKCLRPTVGFRRPTPPVVNLSDLKQGSSESITDFGARVAHIVNDLEILIPAATRVPTGVTWDDAITSLIGWARVAAAVKTKQVQDEADKVILNTYNHLGVQLFISNLKPTIRDEVMKNLLTDLKLAITQARGIKKITSKPDNVAGSITEISLQEGGNTINKEIAALSAQVQALKARRMGNFPTTKNDRSGQNSFSARGGRGGKANRRDTPTLKAQARPLTTCAGTARSQVI